MILSYIIFSMQNMYVSRDKLKSEGDAERGSENEDEEEDKEGSGFGKQKLSEKNFRKFNMILSHLNKKRYSIKTALKFCFKHIHSATHIVESIMTSFVTAQTPQEKIIRMYLISDILYNANNENLANSWIYKTELEEILPEIFEHFNEYIEKTGRANLDTLRVEMMTLLKLWTSWKVFSNLYLEGLEMRVLGKKKINITNEIKHVLESYEDELLEIYSQNKENLKFIAKKHGVYSKGEADQLISRLVSLKEYLLQKVQEKEDKHKQDIELDLKSKEQIATLDTKIKHLQVVLSSLQSSYKKICQADGDGIVIDPVEYEAFNIQNEENKQTRDPGDDIDGEPI